MSNFNIVDVINNVGELQIFEDKMIAGATLLLEGLAEITGNSFSLTDPNFNKTPYRIAKAYLEICNGLGREDEISNICVTDFPTSYTGMIITEPISANSMCPHHFLPVKYKVYFGYVPSNNVLGLSKIGRMIKLLAARPILQEELTKEIIEKFVKHVEPAGAIVVVTGEHTCMQCRGLNEPECKATTSAVFGVFEDIATRAEFFNLIGLRG